MKCKKKLYCAFIDFEKAFDTVWRDALFYKMLLHNINGKMYNVILNMYSDIKSCISYNNCKSEYFACENGVRQGENLSPFLFFLFLNDLESFLDSNNIIGLKTISESLENELYVFLKFFIILYADDTVLLAETADDLQAQLNSFFEYCNTWKMKVNVDKTKVLVFGFGRLPHNLRFSYDNVDIEIVKQFNYLGVIFTKTGNFNFTKKHLSDKALRAMYEVLRFGRQYELSIKGQLELFDRLVKPIMLYGCEVWGFGNNDMLEKIHLKFCKILLNLKSSTPNYMVYGELGRFPIDIDIKLRSISFWARLITGKQAKYSNVLYRLCHHLHAHHNLSFKCIQFVKKIFNDCGYNYIWDTQNFINIDWLKTVIKQRLTDQFIQNWNSTVQNSSKAINYRIFKTQFEFEEYFNILDHKDAISFCRFRTTNNKLPIETGRWRNIVRENRLCTLCNDQEIGDEYHYIFKCNFFSNERKQCIKPYFINRHNTIKFFELMCSKRKQVLKKMCKFIKLINNGVCPPGS